MKNKFKIVLILPDALSIRNYLYSDLIEELIKQNCEVFLYHNVSNDAMFEIEKYQKNIKKTLKIPFFIENFQARILRESIAYARLLRNKKVLKNDSIMFFWSRKNNNWKQIILYRLSEYIGFLLSKSYKFIEKADLFYENEINKSHHLKQVEIDLKSFDPDLILNLHPRTISSALITNISKKLNFKTATVIYSWDNIPKARLISRYDNYFVWSDLMKNDLVLLYPEINLKQISVTGTPQFEFYFKEKFTIKKEIFFQKYGLDINKKTICFSANDQTSPYEQNYFQDLCEELSKLNDLERPQILFRNCPVDKSNRFDENLKKYNKFVKPILPDWKTDELGVIYPTYNDFYLLVNTVKHSDLVINLGSTMSHDFAVLNKPCLYLNYDPVENSKFKVQDVYKFQHFRSMKNIEAVGWINSKEDFIPKIIETLENPQETGKDKKLWMQKIVKHPLNENSKILGNEIISICTSAF
jgi:hypothetical protein